MQKWLENNATFKGQKNQIWCLKAHGAIEPGLVYSSNNSSKVFKQKKSKKQKLFFTIAW